ncbi:MAG TPA: TIGR03085 family metal-binding protein [Nocardioidaceae bacterium]|jgi:uncharacterized protein (TIGR03085 family)|nr:TIGR03085 family metal-binding protein [Nocardioidaceae bacterium]
MTWVEGERRSLAADFRAADPNAPTLCAGWTTRHLCAHLVQREHAMLRNVWDQAMTKAPGEEPFLRRLVDDAGTPDGYTALVDRFEAGPSRRSLMSRFDEAVNLVEYVVHHEDLRRGSGPVPPRDLPAAELAEIWRRARLILKRAYRKAPVGVELAPDGGRVAPVKSGPSVVTVAGSPLELILHAFGRRGAADVRVDGSADDVDSFTRWASPA